MKQTRLYLRELTRESELALGTVQQEMKNLIKQGLILSEKSGNRTYYQANKNHILYPEIHGLVIKTDGLSDLLRESLNGGEIEWAIIFGSIAGNREKEGSDIDLLIIGDTTLRKVSGLLDGAALKLGREINPIIYSHDTFQKKLADKDRFLLRVIDEKKIFIKGCPDEFKRLAK